MVAFSSLATKAATPANVATSSQSGASLEMTDESPIDFLTDVIVEAPCQERRTNHPLPAEGLPGYNSQRRQLAPISVRLETRRQSVPDRQLIVFLR